MKERIDCSENNYHLNKERIKEMKIEEVKLHSTIYRGKKVTYNSRRGAGMTVEGKATDINHLQELIIICDSEGFPHAIDSKTAIKVE